MNRAVRTSFPISRTNASLQFNALFHSTSVLDRARKPYYRINSYISRFRSKEAKRALLRDVDMYLEHILNGSRNFRWDDPQNSSSGYTPWSQKQHFTKGRQKNQFYNQGHQWTWAGADKRKGPGKLFWNDGDQEEFEDIFGSPSTEEQNYQRQNRQSGSHHGSARYEQKRFSRGWKRESRNEDNKSTVSELMPERRALGLTTSGPLNLKDIKNAYHACALRWHPDRHQGPSKEAAEEKFKHCTAAYKALCDRLAIT